MDNKAKVTVINPTNAPKQVNLTGKVEDVVLIPPRGRNSVALSQEEQGKYREAGLIVNPK